MRTKFTRANRDSSLALAAAFTTILASGLLAQSEPATLTVPNTNITQGTAAYQATTAITTGSAFTASGAASVLFQVTNTIGTSITLLPGFTATAGTAATTFKALVGPLASTPVPISGGQQINAPQTTTFTFQDTGDSQPIAGGDITFSQLDGSGNVLNQCPVEFVVSGATMSLSLLDTGTSSDGTCTINAGASSISVGSEVVTVNLNVTFLVAGTYTVNSDAIDASGLLFPWQAAGSWTVTAAPAISGFSPISATQNTPSAFTGADSALPKAPSSWAARKSRQPTSPAGPTPRLS